MSAEADLITAARTGVLLAPTAAITPDREAGKYYVNRVRTGADGVRTTERVEVTIGLKDGNWTEITSGLRAGDEVVIGELTVPQVSGSTGFFGSGMRNGEGSGSPFGQ